MGRTVPAGGLASRAAGVAHETIEEFQGRATKARQRLVGRAEAGRRSMANQAGGIVQRVTNYVEENPFTSVTLAFGVGILVSVALRASGVNLARLLTPPSPPEDDATG
jgi:ElaB/YqjD/DUF883 family membrane-anchored ribosome-binding protein